MKEGADKVDQPSKKDLEDLLENGKRVCLT